MTARLQADGVRVRLGRREVLRGVSLEAGPGITSAVWNRTLTMASASSI